MRSPAATCLLSALLVLGSLGTALPARADEVTDQIDEAVKAYHKKDYATAGAALDAASKLIRQLRADDLAKLLPDPLDGWKADDAEKTSMGAALLGGATTVVRHYHKGNQSVEVNVTTDSPMVQGMGALLGSALMAGGDNKLVILDGRKLTYTKSDNSYQCLIGGKALVKVSGDPSVDDATLKAYWKGTKLDELEKLSQ